MASQVTSLIMITMLLASIFYLQEDRLKYKYKLQLAKLELKSLRESLENIKSRAPQTIQKIQALTSRTLEELENE